MPSASAARRRQGRALLVTTPEIIATRRRIVHVAVTALVAALTASL
jgi:hypothetical protein